MIYILLSLLCGIASVGLIDAAEKFPISRGYLIKAEMDRKICLQSYYSDPKYKAAIDHSIGTHLLCQREPATLDSWASEDFQLSKRMLQDYIYFHTVTLAGVPMRGEEEERLAMFRRDFDRAKKNQKNLADFKLKFESERCMALIKQNRQSRLADNSGFSCVN